MNSIVCQRLVFVRHAVTEWNTAGKIMGQMDIPPTKEGLRLAKLAAASLTIEVSWIVSSPLQRALKTSQIFSFGRDIPVQISSLWMERYWGPFEGLLKIDRPNFYDPPGVEAWADFVARVLCGVNHLPKDGIGLVVSHSGVFKALLALGFCSPGHVGSLPHCHPIILTAA